MKVLLGSRQGSTLLCQDLSNIEYESDLSGNFTSTIIGYKICI